MPPLPPLLSDIYEEESRSVIPPPPTQVLTMRKYWGYVNVLEPGERAAGLVCIRRMNEADNPEDQRYRMKWLCCGEEVTLTHKQISDRVKYDRKQCRACANQQLAKKMNRKLLSRKGRDAICAFAPTLVNKSADEIAELLINWINEEMKNE